MRRNIFIIAAAAALFVTPQLSHTIRAQAAPAAPAAGQAPAGGQGQAPAGPGGAVQGGGAQGVVGGVTPPAGGGQGGRAGRGGGRGAAPPAGPAPRNAQGRVLLAGATPKDRGLWTPNFGIRDPLLNGKQTPYMEWSRALWDDREKHELEPHARCKASGVSRQFMTPYGVEFVELPEAQRIFIFDVGGPHTYRTVFMDGRQHPKDLTPTYYGHSIGKWEGDTLVIDSVGFNESFWLDRRGMPHTEKLHTVEKFTRTDANTIRYEATIDDPGAYTAPWTGSFTLRWEANTELFEYVCQQANFASELMVGEMDKVDRTTQIIP
jgi:hypothetical protein